MTSGKASKMIGWVLLQIYEKQGLIASSRDDRNWRIYDESKVKELRDKLLQELAHRGGER